MLGIPKIGDRVMVYPTPGRKVQDGARPLDSGGRFLPESGKEVVFEEFHIDQVRSGDLMFHDPKGSEKKPAVAKEKV